ETAPGGTGGAGGKGGSNSVAFGGAMYFESGSKPQLYGIQITGCYAKRGNPGDGGDGGDGGLDLAGEDIDAEATGGDGGETGDIATGGIFDETYGGAMYFETGCEVNIDAFRGHQTLISDCRTDAAASAVPGSGGTGGADDGTLDGDPGEDTVTPAHLNDQVKTFGGANYYGAGCDITMRNTTIQDNHTWADYGAGQNHHGSGEYFEADCTAIYEDVLIQSNGSSTTANLADTKAGGLYIIDPAGSTFTDCEFADNMAYDAAGVYVDVQVQATIDFVNCTFKGHVSNIESLDSSGGAVYVRNPNYSTVVGRAAFEGCVFEENISAYGGGIRVDAVEMTVSGSTFQGNQAMVGASIYANACDLTVFDSLFYQNSASTLEQTSGYGSAGAVYSLNSSTKAIYSSFFENQSTGYGGAVLVQGPGLTGSYEDQTITNCLFVQNEAVISGGAVTSDEKALLEIRNCTLTENSASLDYGSGGGVDCYGSDTLIVNSILWNNQAAFGPQISVGDPFASNNPLTVAVIEYSDLEGGFDAIAIGEPADNCWAFNGMGNIDDDPLFVSISDASEPGGRTFYLSQRDPSGLEPLQGALFDPNENNPCVDAGTGTAEDLSALLGFDATTRTDHGADTDPIDMGFHYDASEEVSEYTLETRVFVADRFPYGILEVTTEPNNVNDQWPDEDPAISKYQYLFKQGSIVELLATPETGYQVARWFGADSEPFYYGETNTITMAGPKQVQVEFELGVPKNLYVPETYNTIEDAVIAGRDGDTIVLAPRPTEPYLINDPEGINFGRLENGDTKNLVLTSTDPNDPLVVASTIIDCQG
ncbi:MAG: right-handed parallel beta-helix repeat-containing protein, partial [Planctomycetota bacterium]